MTRAGLGLALGLLGGVAWAEPAMEVRDEKTFVYFEPSEASAVLRRVYPGEVLSPEETVLAADGARWVKVKLGLGQAGYVPAARLAAIPELPEREYQAPTVVRDENPLGFGVRFLGETFGVALNIRYLFLTRLGVVLGGGTVIDEWDLKGTNLSFGLCTHLALYNLSPMIEIGVQNLSYQQGASTLRIWALYSYVGLEWMFDFGLYLSAGAMISRSLNMEVAFSFEDTDRPDLQRDRYGRFEELIDRSVFLAIEPSVTLGFGF